MSLPEKFVQDGLALSKECRLFGQRLEDMTRDELIAAAAKGWEALMREQEDNRKRLLPSLRHFTEAASYCL